MDALRILFSPSGRLPARPFVLAVIAVYAAGMASQWLTMPDVIARAGLWPFVAAQAVLVWIWYALHAKRLRDAGGAVGIAAGVSLLYVLSIVLLIIVAASFFNNPSDIPDANAASAFELVLLVSIVALLLGSPHYDFAWVLVAFLTFMAFVPVIVAAAVSIWSALRPSAGKPML